MLSKFRQWRQFVNAIDRIPGPERTILPFGNIFQLMKNVSRFNNAFFTYQRKMKDIHGPVFRIWAGQKPIISVTSPQHVKEIVMNDPENFTKGGGFDTLEVLVGNSIVNSEGDRWRNKRSIMKAGFTNKALKEFVPIYAKCGERVAEQWAEQLRRNGNQPIDVDLFHHCTQITLEVIGMTGFDYDIRLNPNFAHDLQTTLDGLAEFNSSFYQMLPQSFFFKTTKKGKAIITAIENMQDVVEKIIKHRLENPENHPNDLLSLMMQSMKELGELDPKGCRELRDEVLLFLFAGHETTASLLSWTFYYLSKDQAILNKMKQEINEIFKDDPAVTIEKLDKMRYTLNVLKECLRLSAPAPAFVRGNKKEITLGGHVIPAGSQLLISSQNIHTDETIWPNPLAFDPERYTPENSAGRHAFAWIPFGAGARNCIGMQFSLLEARAVLAVLLPKFNIKVTNEPIPHAMVVVRPDKVEASISWAGVPPA